MTIETTASVAADHPALAGHFPGRPVVPAAVLLDLVIRIAEAETRCRIAEVSRMKFHRPAPPGAAFSVRLRPIAGGRLEVACHLDDEPLLSGTLRTAPGDTVEGAP